jgi:hypothetical protein
MSNKSTIVSGPTFSLSTDLFDNEQVYLELDGVEFEATNQRVQVAIPIAIWEVIRKHSPLDLSLIDKSDAEIQQMAEAEVDQRRREDAEVTEQARKWSSTLTSLAYGFAETSRETQVAEVRDYFVQLRQWQIKVQKDIDDLQAI